MAKKKNSIPSGFEDLLGNIYSNTEQQDGATNLDDVYSDPIDDEKETVEEPPVKQPEDGKKTDDTVVDNNVKEDNSPIPEDVLNNVNNNQEPTKEEPEESVEPTDADVIEAQQVGLLFDAIGASFGWNMDEIDENDRPLTVDDLTAYMGEVVRQNSVPQYADERIQALDEYVKNGGKFEDFYAKQQEGLSLENLDLENETNQKAVIRDLMKYNGYSDEQIKNKIARYEDADMLYEESEDALDRLKQIRQREIEESTRRQEEYAQAQEQQSRAFYEAVSNDINSLTNIRGIAIPKEDRKALFDYIFKVDQTGKSQYTKDFEKNLSKNLIESAYFTMKADALIQNAKKDGESSAAEKLRNMLRHTSKNHSSYNVEDKQKSVTDLLKGVF